MGNCFGIGKLREVRDEGSRIPALLASGLRVYSLQDVTEAFVLTECRRESEKVKVSLVQRNSGN